MGADTWEGPWGSHGGGQRQGPKSPDRRGVRGKTSLAGRKEVGKNEGKRATRSGQIIMAKLKKPDLVIGKRKASGDENGGKI